MGIARFEQRLEDAVEGFFSRVFRSGLRPVEMGRRLVRELDASRNIGVRGATIVPNSFLFQLNSADFEQLADMANSLRRDLADAVREHARDEAYSFAGPVEIEFVESGRQRPGTFALQSRFVESAGGSPVGSLLLPGGDRVPLGEYVVTIGRHPDSTIVLADPNASRHHAEVRLESDGYHIVDLGSTNGTLVNESRVADQVLIDRDRITLGGTVIHYEAL